MNASPPVPTTDISGLCVLVTGATSGIGVAIASGAAAAGARVYVHGRSAADATEVAARIGGRPLAGDLSRSADIAALCQTVAADAWGLDVLVNNAGIEQHATADQLEQLAIAETFAVNYTAPALLVRGLLPTLSRSAYPSILNISSIHDRVPFAGNSTYAASKSALRMLTETLAVELGPRGIRVNSLAPGAIATDINRGTMERIGADRFAELIPLGRVGDVHDVVGPALFLSSRAAAYVSGATLVVDGAYSHHLVRYRDHVHIE